MSESDIDIDLLIDEVRKRPAIWDIASESYGNKIIKRRAWEELVLVFCDDTDSQEKNIFQFTDELLATRVSACHLNSL